MFDQEGHYIKLLTILVGIYGGIIALVNLFFDVSTASLTWKLVYAAGAFVLPLFMWFDKENRILLGLVRLIDWKNSPKRPATVLGTWDIVISFESESDKKEAKRTGHLEVARTTLGLKIDGAELIDPVDQRTTMLSWTGTHVALLEKDGIQLLVYVYETKESEAEDAPDKMGVVIAGRRTKSNVFSGVFHDFETTQADHATRSGTVLLRKPSS